MSTVIEVEKLSKAYQLGEFGTGALSYDLQRSWARMRGKEDPFLKIGEVNDRATKSESDFVWSLKDINFKICQGEAVGLIGPNGAGKSTLLKILSRITSPTQGSVKIKGRIASLLEVGTGFHAELTGRENIFLNGAILGMRNVEIKRKMDEIIHFSGVERYIDTPVKRYSSGMYVRLAFAVAAHLESEILILDEVLAVGDAEFQKKCLGKLDDVSKGEGRTILFVSHNLTAIKSLCKTGILLSNGMISSYDNISNVINKYLTSYKPVSSKEFEPGDALADNNQVRLIKIEFLTKDQGGTFMISEELAIKVSFINKCVFTPLNVNLFFNTPDGVNIFATCSESMLLPLGETVLKCVIPANVLNDDVYSIDVMIVTGSAPILFIKEPIIVEGVEPAREGAWLGKFPGFIRPTFDWVVEND